MKKFIFLIIFFVSIQSAITAQEYIRVTMSADLKEVKFIDDSIAEKLQNIIFRDNPEFAKNLKDYKYISLRTLGAQHFFCQLSNHLYLTTPPVGYLYLNGYCFLIRQELPKFLAPTEKMKTFHEKVLVSPTGFIAWYEDDTPALTIRWIRNSIKEVEYF